MFYFLIDVKSQTHFLSRRDSSTRVWNLYARDDSITARLRVAQQPC